MLRPNQNSVSTVVRCTPDLQRANNTQKRMVGNFARIYKSRSRLIGQIKIKIKEIREDFDVFNNRRARRIDARQHTVTTI